MQRAFHQIRDSKDLIEQMIKKVTEACEIWTTSVEGYAVTAFKILASL